MIRTAVVILAFALVTSVPAWADGTASFPNTGYDPTAPLTSLGVDVTETTLTANATQTDRTLSLEYAVSHGAVTLTLPYRDTLSIGGLGSAHGAGDIGFTYDDVFMHRGRFTQAVGIGIVLPNGNATFSAGQTQLVPSYALSYHVWKRLHVIATAQYAFPMATRVGFAQTQTFSLAPGALVNLSHGGAYALLSAEWDRTSGDYRYAAYRGIFRIGDVLANRFNLSAFVAAPLRSNFTYDHVFHVAYGVRLAIQR